MKSLALVFAAAAALAITVMAARAQNETTRYAYDRNGNCTYSNYGGYETYYSYDVHGNLTYQYSTGVYPQPKRPKEPVAPAPVVAATNPSHATRRVEGPVAIMPARTVVQAPVVIVESTEAEMRAESVAGAARVKAQKEEEAKAEAKAMPRIKSEIKNGE